MRLFRPLLTPVSTAPFFCQPLSSRFALHGLRALEKGSEKVLGRVPGRDSHAKLTGEITLKSGKKKEHKPKLSSPDIFRWGGGLQREGVGAKKFGKPLEAREIKLFLAGYPGTLLGYPGGARKV